MSGYTPLFGSIVTSSIWNEDNETRLVWITMLALADCQGIVEGSVPGLAYVARVSTEECRKAIQVLSSPDPDSRTADHEGRRIHTVDGGWQIYNLAKFRQKAKSRAAYMQEWRERKKEERSKEEIKEINKNLNKDLNKNLNKDLNKDLNTDTDKVTPRNVRVTPVTVTHPFTEFWDIWPKKLDRIESEAIWKKLNPDDELFATIKSAVNAWIASGSWDKKQYIPSPAKWLRRKKWLDEVVLYDDSTNNPTPSKIRLFPLHNGRQCSERDCGLPAVWKSTGEYEHPYCRQHIPEKAKKRLRKEGYDV